MRLRWHLLASKLHQHCEGCNTFAFLQMEWSAGTQAFVAAFSFDTSACTPSAVPMSAAEIAIATVIIDVNGDPLAETFYPYYGSKLKSNFLPTPQATFQSTFQPYTVRSLAPAAPRFLSGYPTASGITASSFTLEVSLSQAVDFLQYVVLSTDVANNLIPDLSSATALDNLFAADVASPGRVAATGQATAVNPSGGRASEFQAPIALDTADNGGSFAAFVAARAGCSITYGVLTDIALPDTAAPAFLDVSVASECDNLLPSSGQAFYTVTATLNEAASVRFQSRRHIDL